MRVASVVLFLLLLSTGASAQFLIHGGAGPTLNDAGYSVAGGIGFSASRVSVLFDVERTHLESRVTSDGRGGSAFRGGDFTIGAAELRVLILGRQRVTPYALVGAGAGISRPTVNERFPIAVTNRVTAAFAGGGLHVPAGDRLSVFGDVRMIVGAEAGELLALVPVRAGLAFRF